MFEGSKASRLPFARGAYTTMKIITSTGKNRLLGKTEVLEESLSDSLCTAKISYGLVQNKSRVFAIRD